MGTQLWAARYSNTTSGNDAPHAIGVDLSNNVIVTGERRGTGSNYYDWATVKYDPNGNQLWAAIYNGTINGSDVANDLTVDGAGAIYVTGYTDQAGYDFATIKYYPNGTQAWLRTYDSGTSSSDHAEALVLDAQANVYVTGSSSTSATMIDFATLKYDSAGNPLWAIRYNGTVEWPNDDAKDIAVDNQGNIYVTGGSVGSEATMDVFTIKYTEGIVSPVTITLTPINPPIQIPATGGSFNFDAQLTNTTTSPQTFGVWIMVQLPNSAWYGPVLGPLTLTLPASLSVTRQRTQAIPGGAPAGAYLYEGRVGTYPATILDSDNFPFNKLSLGNGPVIGEWSNTGEEFGVGWGESDLPRDISVNAAPNPFNPSTVISYELRAASSVKLQVLDINGRDVGARLASPLPEGWQEAGSHHVTFDGSGLPSGVYFYRIQAEGLAATGKMLLLK
jgi:hypothetical protein